uniref:Uncharacterized protein n=1 Tax=Guillardia theta TaxID=55529 RepID=A0A6U6B6P3_GUITH
MLTFWQTAALLVEFRIAWPQQVLSLLSLYSISNLNIMAVPWMCFFNWQPNFLQRWILTNLVLFGVVSMRVLLWILPFLILPPKMKTVFDCLVRVFTRKSNRRNYEDHATQKKDGEGEGQGEGEGEEGDVEMEQAEGGAEDGEDGQTATRKEAFLISRSEDQDSQHVPDEITPIEAFDESSADWVQTPSRKNRRKEGWTEYSVHNVYQTHIPKMIRKQEKHPNSWIDFSVPSTAVDWRMRKKYFDMAWREAVAVLNLLYIMGSVKTLEAFKWTYWTSKIALLDADPSVQPFDTQHTAVFSLALIVLPITVFGPVINFVLLYIGHRLRMLDDPSFRIRFGFLLDPFERRFWYWNLVVSLRKMIFVLSLVFLQHNLFLQKFFPLLAVCINFILNIVFRPYNLERNNLLENFLLLILMLLLLLGMISPIDIALYHDTNGRNDPGPYETKIILVTIAAQFLVQVVSIRCIISEVVEAQLRMPLWARAPLMIILAALSSLKGLVSMTKIMSAYILKPTSDPEEVKDSKPAKLHYKASDEGQVITGDHYADIWWQKLFKMRKTKDALSNDAFRVKKLKEVHWLQNRFTIRKRAFHLERRMEQIYQIDSKSMQILRLERELSEALDAAIAYARREEGEYADQMYDLETEHEILCKDYEEAKRKYDEEAERLSEIEDETNFYQAQLDANIRKVGQSEEWKGKFLSEKAKRERLEQEIVDLQAQINQINLAGPKED